jgi:hypothetical protein
VKCPHCGREIANGFELTSSTGKPDERLVEIGQGEEIARIKLTVGEAVVRKSAVDGWDPGYPNVDIPTTLRQMRDYWEARPRKRKTPKGIKAAIVDWLRREQDRG